MKRTFPGLFVLACLAVPLQAQLPIGFGLKGGARLSDFTQDYGGSSSSGQTTKQDHIYTIGPYAELHLPVGFSIEADLLYKKSGATFLEANPFTAGSRQFNFDSFDVPILLKKRFGEKALFFRPFLEGGLANRYSTGLPGSTSSTNPLTAGTHGGWQEGITLGGGVEFKVLLVKVSGELRWTRYGNISASTIPKISANQAEFLIGVGF
jgi:opacity protein-like surface antigen